MTPHPPLHLVVSLLGEVGVVAAARPAVHAVVEVGHVFNVAAGDEGAKALLSREVEVAGVAADGSWQSASMKWTTQSL